MISASVTNLPRRLFVLLIALLVILLAVLLTRCSEPAEHSITKAEPATTKAELGPVPASAQRHGDPEEGWRILVNEGYVTCGIPYQAWRRVAGTMDSEDTELPGRKGRNAGLPYFLNHHVDERGVELVTTNCLWCHGGRFQGRVIPGLGNQDLDFTRDPRGFVNAAGSYVSGPDQTAAWSKWARRMEVIAPYMITDTVGVNPAPNLTLALVAHRDGDSLAWSEEPLLAPPSETPLPVKVPPWWRMSKQHAMFHNAMGRGDHTRFMMMKALVCSDTVEEARRIDAMFADVRAYIASLEPPAWPYGIDEELAGQGRAIFEAHCASCHGTYGAEPDYPNLVVGLDQVGTDPTYALQAYEQSDHFMAWFNQSWYGQAAEARPALGYRAPPLDGVWITAPFLHNGSVPTLAALLDSSLRPTYWLRSFDSSDFDIDAVGWHFEALSHGKEGEPSDERRRRIYDTTLPGYSNQGHTFGDRLSGSERRALLEYLKTL